MFYSEESTKITSRPILIEGRYKTTENQKIWLREAEKGLGIPQSALIRMALDSFIPKTENCGYTKKGIRAGYLNGNY